MRRARSASTSANARRVTRTIAESITSWLVLPRWTNAAAAASRSATRAVSRLTSGIARLPAGRASATSASMSNSPRQAAAIGAAAPAGITPSAASASASAASNASIAATTARSANTSTIAALASVRAKIGAVMTASSSRVGGVVGDRRGLERARQDLVDTLAVEVDHLEAPALPIDRSRRSRAAGRAAA